MRNRKLLLSVLNKIMPPKGGSERSELTPCIYYRIITTVERDTEKYHEFIAGIVYECAARVNNTGGNERVMFPRYRVHTVVIMFLSYANAKK